MGHTITTKFAINDEVSCVGCHDKQIIAGVSCTLFWDKWTTVYKTQSSSQWQPERIFAPWVEPLSCKMCGKLLPIDLGDTHWSYVSDRLPTAKHYYRVCDHCHATNRPQPEHIENEFERRLFGDTDG